MYFLKKIKKLFSRKKNIIFINSFENQEKFLEKLQNQKIIGIDTSLSENKIIYLSNDFYVHRYYMNKVLIKIRKFLIKKKKLSVGEFKNIIGLTRKTAIPFLEYLDKIKITYRNGNSRELLM